MLRKSMAIMTAAMMILSFSVLAGDKMHGKDHKMHGKSEGMHKTFSGTLTCLGCDLKSSGANAQCKAYGHKHALKLEDGTFISFMENDQSTKLIEGGKMHNAEVEIHGVYFGDANMLDVESFNFDDKSFGWCAGHSSMDMCHSKKMGKKAGY